MLIILVFNVKIIIFQFQFYSYIIVIFQFLNLQSFMINN